MLNFSNKNILSNSDLVKKFTAIQSIIKPNISIEVGSFDAGFSKSMIGIVPNGSIWAFEASPYVHNNFNPIAKVNYINKAVSNVNGTINFEIQSDFSPVIGNNSIMNRNEQKNYAYIEVQSITLDSLFSAYENISLWVDCEGANREVLTGSLNILKNVSSIFIEVEEYEFWKNQWLFDDVYSYLTEYGFILVNKDQEYGNTQYNCIFIKKELEEMINNVAI